MLGDGICTLAYLHKDGVTNCKEIEKDCDNWKRSRWLKKIVIKKIIIKKIVIIEKDCNDWTRLW